MSRSIIPGDEPGKCYICTHYGRPPEALREEGGNGYCAAFSQQIEEHHIFGGPCRKSSEHYGLKVHLCIYHHTSGSEAVHNNRIWDLRLKRIGQQAFENKYSHGMWMQIFGQNYLGQVEDQSREKAGQRENMKQGSKIWTPDASPKEKKKMALVDECVTDCGNLNCKYNAANTKGKNVFLVFMRDKKGCEGYKPVAKKAKQKKKTGEIARKGEDAPKKKANAPEKAGKITAEGKNTPGKKRAAAGRVKTKKASAAAGTAKAKRTSAAAGRAKKKRITSGKVKK